MTWLMSNITEPDEYIFSQGQTKMAKILSLSAHFPWSFWAVLNTSDDTLQTTPYSKAHNFIYM